MGFGQLSLRSRVVSLVGLLLLVVFTAGTFTMWRAYDIHDSLTSVLDKNMLAQDYAHELESSLVLQKGYLAHYLGDGQPRWLSRLEHYGRVFEDRLKKARETAFTLEQRNLLNDIESKSIHYAHARDEVLGLVGTGRDNAIPELDEKMNERFYALWGLCERYRELHRRSVNQERLLVLSDVTSINLTAFAAMVCSLLLGASILHVLFNRILGPIRRLCGVHEGAPMPRDEVEALGRRVESLISDMDQTQSALQQSREHLLQAEKLAMVGKLAAGVAHSIRNPLTSVKMRLFSLERSLTMDAMQREDLVVISEEIRHIDTIVRNFLEFSRRPKLALQKISPSDVVDSAIQLLIHRLESYGVELELYRQRRLPDIEGDPEQLKEVLVNLIVNACEAMGEGGRIQILEEEGKSEPMGHVAVIRVVDNGPGIAEINQEKVFQPFFSTREEGTGLGLSIAARIIEDHKGCLNLKSREGKGTTFTITLPCKEERGWLRS